jgi:CheY-like chemotaxis protein
MGNLVGNAIKFTEKGHVSITCSGVPMASSPEKILIMFSVVDTGIGIAEENHAKIFESFTQESSDTTRRFGGTGLGLAITKKLIEMHGGKIKLNSTPGKGTEFLFDIPYRRHDASAKEFEIKKVGRQLKESLKGIRVLLVEDNLFNRMVAIDTLEQEIEGVYIDVALNGIEAIEKIESGDYDVVLMDVQMPEMNGYDATRAIRKLPFPKNKIRIIAMTASALKEEVKHCFEAGMDEFIAKPFSTEELLFKMSAVTKDSAV